jgi:phenylpropionate dioxygenase-like ring-hydroxylating dioxygenase large terminal subunit
MQLPPGSLKSVTLCGKDIVVFRPQDGGEPAAIDAYCTHLGAHLGAGGGVVGDCIECPFHAWRFGPDGALRWNPAGDHKGIGSAATIPTYPCIRRSGVIAVWLSSSQHARDCPAPSEAKRRVDDVPGGKDLELERPMDPILSDAQDSELKDSAPKRQKSQENPCISESSSLLKKL